jgi:hypothetical protein
VIERLGRTEHFTLRLPVAFDNFRIHNIIHRPIFSVASGLPCPALTIDPEI